ncbi:MAG: glycoside hydrolase family 99-like domain-containing protein [Eubacteriales bacterium]
MDKKIDVAAYIWPSYTGTEPRTLQFWPEGMGEWQSVRSAGAKYPGHQWPRKPLWGYVDEADPYVMEMQINAAADHGVNVFIYDWYWYDKRPFLEQCLNNGYLKAKNNDRVKFYIMWANHDALSLWDKRISSKSTLVWDGATDKTEYDRVVNRIITNYFSHPSYYKIDGKPVFMIYDINNLMRGLGGIDNTRKALDAFREATVKAGFPGLHIQLTAWSEHAVNLSGVDSARQGSTKELVELLGFDSITHYQFVHYVNIDRDYLEILPDVKKEWERIDAQYKVPYFPHISVGWDNNPRYFDFRGGIVKNNTPENVKKAFEMAKDYIESHPTIHPLVTVNSWNEWTETSYLQPDDLYGYGYLEAIRDVFGAK